MGVINIYILIIGAVIFFFIIFIISSSFKNKPETWKDDALAKLNKITTSTENKIELKNSLIQADKLLDFVLKNKKVKGDTLGERLKNSKTFFNKADYNLIWEAHKMRNVLVHEIEENITIAIIRQNIRHLSSAIRNLLNAK